MRRTSRPPMGWLAAAVSLWAWSAPGVFAAPGDDSPLRVALFLQKERYLFCEEMPVLVTVTNVAPVGGWVQTPVVDASVAFEVVDRATNEPVPARVMCTTAGGAPTLRLRKQAAAKDASETPTKPKERAPEPEAAAKERVTKLEAPAVPRPAAGGAGWHPVARRTSRLAMCGGPGRL